MWYCVSLLHGAQALPFRVGSGTKLPCSPAVLGSSIGSFCSHKCMKAVSTWKAQDWTRKDIEKSDCPLPPEALASVVGTKHYNITTRFS